MAFLSGTGLIASLLALLIAGAFPGGVTIPGIGNWALAALILWLTMTLGAVLAHRRIARCSSGRGHRPQTRLIPQPPAGRRQALSSCGLPLRQPIKGRPEGPGEGGFIISCELCEHGNFVAAGPVPPSAKVTKVTKVTKWIYVTEDEATRTGNTN